MWGHYSDFHRGVCLEIEVGYDHFVPVTYTTQKLPFRRALLDSNNNEKVKQLKQDFATKAKGWEYEEEVRGFFPLRKEEGLISLDKNENYFLCFNHREDHEFILRKIYVGFRYRQGINQLQKKLKDHFEQVEVQQTRPAFGEFKVVQQKNDDYWNMDAAADGEQTRCEESVWGYDPKQ